MASDDVLLTIQDLAHEEHELREREGPEQLSDEDKARLQWLEDRLDQCWDFLRQRRALVSVGLDPDEASVRGVETVEHYRQ